WVHCGGGARRNRCFRRPARRAPAPSSPSSRAEIAMEAWSRFLDTFFNWDVIERYFPAIMKGVVVTIEIAAAVVVTGTLLGLALAIVRTFRLLAVNALIVVFVDMFRALPPLVLVISACPTLASICRPSRCFGWCLRLYWLPLPRRSFGPAFCLSRRGSGRRRVPPAWAFSARSPISCCRRRSA